MHPLSAAACSYSCSRRSFTSMAGRPLVKDNPSQLARAERVKLMVADGAKTRCGT